MFESSFYFSQNLSKCFDSSFYFSQNPSRPKVHFWYFKKDPFWGFPLVKRQKNPKIFRALRAHDFWGPKKFLALRAGGFILYKIRNFFSRASRGRFYSLQNPEILTPEGFTEGGVLILTPRYSMFQYTTVSLATPNRKICDIFYTNPSTRVVNN